MTRPSWATSAPRRIAISATWSSVRMGAWCVSTRRRASARARDLDRVLDGAVAVLVGACRLGGDEGCAANEHVDVGREVEDRVVVGVERVGDVRHRGRAVVTR